MWLSLVERLLWEWPCRIHEPLGHKPGSPWNTGQSGSFPAFQKERKSGLDHMNDHRQKIIFIAPISCYNSPKSNIRD